MFYGTAGPQLSSGAGFLGTGSRALHRHNRGLHIHSALRALAPSLPDATHNYLITKCPLVMPQTDLWKEKESKKDAGTAMLAFLLHPQSQL